MLELKAEMRERAKLLFIIFVFVIRPCLFLLMILFLIVITNAYIHILLFLLSFLLILTYYYHCYYYNGTHMGGQPVTCEYTIKMRFGVLIRLCQQLACDL